MKCKITLFLLLCTLQQGFSQLFIDTSYSVDLMIHGFFDEGGNVISNVNYSGSPSALSFFDGSQSNIGLNAGLLITTGNATTAVGPNITGSSGTNMDTPGSNFLSSLVNGAPSYDAAIIEMDIVPATDTLCFKYVFASDEYQEFSNSNFNDVFAFLVEGPGLPATDSIYVEEQTIVFDGACTGCIDSVYTAWVDSCYWGNNNDWICDSTLITLTQYCSTYVCLDTIVYPGYWYVSPGGVNIAQLPNTNLPVAINNVNQDVNSIYFIANEPGETVEYDGFTVPLLAKLAVTPGATYHVRVAISDISDGIFDSGVFLSVESLGADSLLDVVSAFTYNPTTPGGTTIQFHNESLWGTSYLWDFGDGETSTEKNPIHDFGRGEYNVTLTVKNYCSQVTHQTTVLTGSSSTQQPNAASFSLSPNPAQGNVSLQLADGNEADVRLFRADGKLVLEGVLQSGATIHLDTYGKGLYILQVSRLGAIHTEKVVNY